MEQPVKEQVNMEQQASTEVQVSEEPFILEDVVIETLAIDGICGVY